MRSQARVKLTKKLVTVQETPFTASYLVMALQSYLLFVYHSHFYFYSVPCSTDSVLEQPYYLNYFTITKTYCGERVQY